MYYVEKGHPSIIDKEMWEAVQLEMGRRKDYMERHGIGQLDFINVHDNPFSGRVICGHCGGSGFGRKTWNSTNENLKRRYGSVIGNMRRREKLGVRISI